MDNNILLDKKIARVLDILEQVKELNKMIDLHRNKSGDGVMVNKYGRISFCRFFVVTASAAEE